MLIKSYIYVFLFLQESYNPLKKISGLSIESSRQIMKRLGGCFLTANQIRFADLPKNSLLLPGQQHQHPTVSWKWTLFLAQEWRFLTLLQQWLLQFTVPLLLWEYGGYENCNVYHLSNTWVINDVRHMRGGFDAKWLCRNVRTWRICNETQTTSGILSAFDLSVLR